MSGAIGQNSQQKIGFHFDSNNTALKIDGKKVNLADAKTITIDDKAGGKKEIQGFIAQDGTIFQVKQGDKAKNGGVDIIVRGTPEQLASYDFGVKNGSVTSARYGENSYRPGVDVTPSNFTIQSGTSGEEILKAHGLVEKQPKVSKDPEAPVINKNNSAASGRDHTKTDTKKLQQETSDAIKANRDQMQKMMEDLKLPMRERESAPSSSSTSKPSAPAPRASDAEKKALSPWEAFTKDVETAREELAKALSSIEDDDGKGAELNSRLDRLESGDFLAMPGDSPVKMLQNAAEEVREIRQEIQDLSPITEENSDQGIQSFQNVTYLDFPSGDNPLGKQNFDYWQKAPNKPDQVKGFVHVPVQGDGLCLLTALAAATNRTTSELIKYLDEVATKSNDKTLLENWKSEKINASKGDGIDSNQIGNLLHAAGLGFIQVEASEDQFNTIDVGGDLKGANLIETNPNAPVLLYRNGHYDNLVRPEVASTLKLPTDGKKYISSDVGPADILKE